MTDHPSGSSKPEETQMDRTVAVTGGSKLGRAVVAAVIEEGWTVVNSDRNPRRTPSHFIRTNLTDYGQGQRSSRSAVDHGVVAAVGRADASCDQTHAAISAGSPNLADARSCPGPRHPESPPATRVVLDSTLTPAAVMIGGIWIG
jgi:NAD(P)-dependent dehydrogenase (short-subunit alcohol dehydrogenase family)